MFHIPRNKFIATATAVLQMQSSLIHRPSGSSYIPPMYSFLLSAAIAQAQNSRSIIAAPDDFFNIGAEFQRKPISISGMPSLLVEDQKNIWTSPLGIKKEDLKWLLPLAGITGALVAADHHTMTLIHSDAAVQRPKQQHFEFRCGLVRRRIHSLIRHRRIHTQPAFAGNRNVDCGGNGRFLSGLGGIETCHAAKQAGNRFRSGALLGTAFAQFFFSVTARCAGLVRGCYFSPRVSRDVHKMGSLRISITGHRHSRYRRKTLPVRRRGRCGRWLPCRPLHI